MFKKNLLVVCFGYKSHRFAMIDKSQNKLKKTHSSVVIGFFLLSLFILLLSSAAVMAVDPPSLTDFMQIYGKIQNFGSMAGELKVQVGEDKANTFSFFVKTDGAYGYAPTFKIIGKDGDKLYLSFEEIKIDTTETYQNKAVKKIDLNLPPDCSKPSTLIFTFGSCIDKKKIGTTSCGGKNISQTVSCCEPNWVNCTDGSSCSSGQRTKTCIDANKCNVNATTKTETESCGGSSTKSPKSSCSSEWQCESWSLCTLGLKKSRTCVDLNDCANDKTEEIACDKCEESWVCNLWSNCISGIQSRSCSDEHGCETSLVKPKTTQSCQIVGAGTQPPSDQKPPTTKTPTCSDGIKNQNEAGVDCGGVCKVCPAPKKTKTDFTVYYLIAGIVLVLGAIGGLVYFLVLRPKSSVLDESTIEELRNVYGTQERRGMSEEEITQKMVDRGWDESVLKKFLGRR